MGSLYLCYAPSGAMPPPGQRAIVMDGVEVVSLLLSYTTREKWGEGGRPSPLPLLAFLNQSVLRPTAAWRSISHDAP